MDETWTSQPCLGPVPDFHADPALGGAPLASADGHWWWDGSRWTPVHAPTLDEAVAHDEHPVQLRTRTQETTQPTPPLAEAS
ncbi:hypothetical protein [Nocardioides sp. T2.26MG-1]|uniref:hypothetical protein n=1 Tax=Nocardioides sp. T2.26MG-1 TaxID=3041166 RepID=UPI0024778FBB|nr:hypothetical protein [Nocardioides sp. T2.26MG-1]CAI9412498.1 hypothetical protein HIDPHFAB_01786 [Nocardioides sp. T2.26MG-1]